MNRMIIPLRRTALWLAACGLLGAACEDNARVTPEDGVSAPLQVESVETEATTTVTRSATALGNGKKIGIYSTVTPTTPTGTSCNPAYYTLQDGVWSSTTPFELWHTDQRVYAIHIGGNSPINYNQTVNNCYVLAAALYNANADVYWAPPRTMSIANPRTSFVMKPMRSRLSIYVKRGDSYSYGNCNISFCSIDKVTVTSLNLSTGEYTIDNAQAQTLSSNNNMSVIANAQIAMSVWMSPIAPNSTQYTNPDRTITMTIDGKTLTTTLPAARYTPKAGVHTIVTVTVNGTGLSVPALSTEDWTDGGSIGDINLNNP